MEMEDSNVWASTVSFGDQLPAIDELEEESAEWQEKLEAFTTDASPDRQIDHCVQIQEDLSILRFWIDCVYIEFIKEPGEKQQEGLDYNYKMKSLNTGKLVDNFDEVSTPKSPSGDTSKSILKKK